MKDYIQINSVINYLDSNGRSRTNRVIRVEANSYIVHVPTIGGTWKEQSIPLSQVVSVTNRIVNNLV